MNTSHFHTVEGCFNERERNLNNIPPKIFLKMDMFSSQNPKLLGFGLWKENMSIL